MSMFQVYLSVITGNIVSFSAGTALTWSSPVTSKLTNSTYSPFGRDITRLEASWITSFLPVGCIFGPFLFGFLPDRIGRKYTILAAGFPLLLSYLILAYGHCVIIFYVGRFIAGLSLGAIVALMPNYVAEIADKSNRGVLASLMGVFISSGVLFSYTIGPYCSIKVFNLCLAAAPFLFLVLFYFFGTESPQYHVSRNHSQKARIILQRLRGPDAKIEEEIEELEKKSREDGTGSFLDIFRSKGLTKAFIMVVGQIFFQQMSGINAVFFFSESIFKHSLTAVDPAVCSIIIGCVQVIGSILTPLLIERLGRRLLLMVSSIAMLVSELLLGFQAYYKHNLPSLSLLPIPCLIVYVIAFGIGLGSVPWIMMAELFPANVKSIASTITATICWIFGFLVAHYFQIISGAIGMGHCFWIFSGFCGLSAIFVYTFVIETRGKSLHEIQEELEC